MPKSINLSINDFNNVLDSYIQALEKYTFAQLCTKPAAASWSLGQMYMHLIDDTRFYLEQIKICVSNNDHATEQAASAAKVMFIKNEFPDEFIEGAPANVFIRQPQSKEQLLRELVTLKSDMNAAAVLINESSFTGKTKHPGLHYFSAIEWLQFAAMHLRHHLRQKMRIDNFLKAITY